MRPAYRAIAATPTWRVAEMMRTRGITTFAALRARLAPYTAISYQNTRRLALGTFVRIPQYEILDALCRALECDISDILPIRYRPRTEYEVPRSKKSGRPSRTEAVIPEKRRELGDPSGVKPFAVDAGMTGIGVDHL